MAKRTLQERLCAALAARGHTEVNSRSRKYRVFDRALNGDCYFVGKAGGFRVGPTATDSVSIMGTAIHRRLLEEQP